METHEEFAKWATAQGVEINSIAAHKFPGRGLGIIAERDFKEGDTLLSVPTSALRTLLTVPKSTSTALSPITVHGLLAATLTLDTSSHYASWRTVLPTATSFRESMPLLWESPLRALLPPSATLLHEAQTQKLSLDWTQVSAAFPEISYENYIYNWCLVNTRTFYFTSPLIRLPKPINRDDCMALNPFADYFNHADEPSAAASFSSPSAKGRLKASKARSTNPNPGIDGTGYQIHALHPIQKGDEISISYGNHSNDFLLAEYGFILDYNQWDEVPLDAHLLPLFSAAQQQVLAESGFMGNYILDATGVCYRTRVAVRLLCTPVGKWRHMVGIGLGEEDQFEEAAGEVLLKALRAFKEEADGKFKGVGALNCGLACQRETLSRRWKQILVLIESAMVTIEGKA